MLTNFESSLGRNDFGANILKKYATCMSACLLSDEGRKMRNEIIILARRRRIQQEIPCRFDESSFEVYLDLEQM